MLFWNFFSFKRCTRGLRLVLKLRQTRYECQRVLPVCKTKNPHHAGYRASLMCGHKKSATGHTCPPLQIDFYQLYTPKVYSHSSPFSLYFVFCTAKLVQTERNAKKKCNFLLCIAEVQPNLHTVKVSARWAKSKEKKQFFDLHCWGAA